VEHNDELNYTEVPIIGKFELTLIYCPVSQPKSLLPLLTDGYEKIMNGAWLLQLSATIITSILFSVVK